MTALATEPQVETLLRYLCETLEVGHYLRLVLQPNWVVATRPTGEHVRLDVAWTDAEHAMLHAALLPQRRRLAHGKVAFTVGSALVLLQPPSSVLTLDDLSQQGWLAPVCARLLRASLALGRNILVVGPWASSVQLITCLVREARLPVLLGNGLEAVPQRFLALQHWQEAQQVGAERIATWSLPAATVAAAMGQLNGMVSWLPAPRLERALMRFETAIEAFTRAAANPSAVGDCDAPLHLLAGLDLVVVMQANSTAEMSDVMPSVVEAPPLQVGVREVAEIVLAEDGYQPHLLFARGQAACPSALLACEAPQFTAELLQQGYSSLVSDLQALLTPPVQDNPPPSDAPMQPSRTAVTPSFARLLAAVPAADPAPTLNITANSAAAVQPGWELDRLVELAPEPLLSSELGQMEDSAMAAMHGLAPPPKPSTASPSPPSENAPPPKAAPGV